MKKILFVSHKLDVSGAPLSMFNIAQLLCNDYDLNFATLADGPLSENYFNTFGKYPLDLSPAIKSNDLSFLVKELKKYDLVLVNTVVSCLIADICDKYDIPYIWVIREGQNIKSFVKSCPTLVSSIKNLQNNIYVVSEYAQEYVEKEFDVKVKIIRNFVHDSYNNIPLKYDNKIVFTFAGQLVERRKGLGILVEAFCSLDNQFRNSYILNICGNENEGIDYYAPIKNSVKDNQDIIWRGIVMGEDKQKLFEGTDVFVVPSLDESCSRVVLEAMMLGRPVIVSENVGAKYMVNKNTGWIVKTADVDSLRECIENILSNPACLPAMGTAAREMYLSTSTGEIYKKNITNIINLYLAKPNFSKLRYLLFRLFEFYKTPDRNVLNFMGFKFSLSNNLSFGQRLFSVKNVGIHKQICLLGAKFKFKNKRKILENKLNDIQSTIIASRETILFQIEQLYEETTAMKNEIPLLKSEVEQLKNEAALLKNKENNLKEAAIKSAADIAELNRKLAELNVTGKELSYRNIFTDTIRNSKWLNNKAFTLTGGSANYSFIYYLYMILDKFKPENILEFGLGQTSKLTSQYVDYFRKNLIIVEHNNDWITTFRKNLVQSDYYKIVQKDLINFECNGIVSDKYAPLDDIVSGMKYNLIIIDGPFGYDRKYPRTNILDLIPNNLAKNFVIILDDAEREGEKNTAGLIFKKLTDSGIAYKRKYISGTKRQLVITGEDDEYLLWY